MQVRNSQAAISIRFISFSFPIDSTILPVRPVNHAWPLLTFRRRSQVFLPSSEFADRGRPLQNSRGWRTAKKVKAHRFSGLSQGKRGIPRSAFPPGRRNIFRGSLLLDIRIDSIFPANPPAPPALPYTLCPITPSPSPLPPGERITMRGKNSDQVQGKTGVSPFQRTYFNLFIL